MGLAWTSMGGSTPYIETVVDRHQLQLRKEDESKAKNLGRLISTGQMGEVMQESCHIAYTCSKIFWAKLSEASKQAAQPPTSSMTTATRHDGSQGIVTHSFCSSGLQTLFPFSSQKSPLMKPSSVMLRCTCTCLKDRLPKMDPQLALVPRRGLPLSLPSKKKSSYLSSARDGLLPAFACLRQTDTAGHGHDRRDYSHRQSASRWWH